MDQPNFSEMNIPEPKKSNQRLWNPKTFKKSELPKHLKRDPFLWRVFKRMHYEDKNVLMIIVGETGAGKSCTGINLARKIDVTPIGDEKYITNFKVKCDTKGKPTADCRVVFSATDFLKLVRSGLPKGSLIVWDEAGIGNDNTSWYDKKSKIVKHVMQTFRKQNLGLILTVPDEESVTLATRRLIHVIIDVTEREKNFVNCSILWIQRNRKSKVDFKKNTVYFDEETGYNTKLAKYLVQPLPEEIEHTYNRIKDNILENFYSFYEDEMKDMDELEGFDSGENEEFVMREFDVVKCIDLCQKDLKDQLIEDEPNKDKIIYYLAKKGYSCNTANARTVMTNLDVSSIVKETI